MYYKSQNKQFEMKTREVCFAIFVTGFIIVIALAYFSGNDPKDVLPYYLMENISESAICLVIDVHDTGRSVAPEDKEWTSIPGLQARHDRKGMERDGFHPIHFFRHLSDSVSPLDRGFRGRYCDPICNIGQGFGGREPPSSLFRFSNLFYG